MKKYRHAVTFVTEIDESQMNDIMLMSWHTLSDKARYNLIKDANKSMIQDMLKKVNVNGSWAILRMADNG